MNVANIAWNQAVGVAGNIKMNKDGAKPLVSQSTILFEFLRGINYHAFFIEIPPVLSKNRQNIIFFGLNVLIR